MKDIVREDILLDFGVFGKRFGYTQKDSAAAIDELKKTLDGKSRWFADMFAFISELRRRNKYTFTDIFIREEKPIMVARPLLRLPFIYEGTEAKPSRDQIVAIVGKFLQLKEREVYSLLISRKAGIDFSFSIFGLGNFRCNFSISASGVNLTIRILPNCIPSFLESNFPNFYKDFVKGLLTHKTAPYPFSDNKEKEMDIYNIRRGGLILHVGQTGSGKTTALSGEVDFLSRYVNGVILTYENPIEYIYSDWAFENNKVIEVKRNSVVYQFDIDGHFMGSFEGVLKHLLRNTPSIAVIGEVRSLDEMDALIDIASRGHLIFATLHASDIFEALDLLFYLSKRKTQLANTLLAIVAHRLKEVVNNGGYKIVPFFEIFLPQVDDAIKGLMKKGNLLEVRKYIEDSGKKRTKDKLFYMSFKEHLHDLLERKIITDEQRRELEAIVRGT